MSGLDDDVWFVGFPFPLYCLYVMESLILYWANIPVVFTWSIPPLFSVLTPLSDSCVHWVIVITLTDRHHPLKQSQKRDAPIKVNPLALCTWNWPCLVFVLNRAVSRKKLNTSYWQLTWRENTRLIPPTWPSINLCNVQLWRKHNGQLSAGPI